jgi:hypothetical protein
MGELATKGSAERKEVLAKLATLTEDEQYGLWGELWAGKHRRTFLTIKPEAEVQQPAPPPPAAPHQSPPPGPLRDPSYLTEADLMEERPLPFRELRRSGVEYVVGKPPATPVLRPLKQTLYDKLIVPESGHIGRVSLFDDCKFFPDHTQKTEKDTNMTLSGQLGFPLEFDLSWIDLKFEKFAHPDDVRRVLRGLTFKWIRGQCTPWLRVTLSGFEPRMDLEGVGDGELKEFVNKELKKFQDAGIWTRYRAGVLTPDGLPQRLSSTESFRVEVASPEGGIGELHGPVHLKVLLGDQLYAQL